MDNTTRRSGKCLCGAVRVTANQCSNSIGACHCATCRTWVSGPLIATDAGIDVEIEGREHVTIYDSSAWAERGFCSRCGTSLFYRLKESGQYILSVGLFEPDEQMSFDHQIFIDEKPSLYSFSDTTENMTGAEVFAKYAPPEE